MWRVAGFTIIIAALFVASCNNSITIPSLCPTGPGGDWVVIQPETLEFIEGAVPVDLGNLKEFRFIMVATDGKPVSNATACAAALVYPEQENLPVYSSYSYHQVLQDISKQSLVLDANAVGRDPVYVYFVGLDTQNSSADVNSVAGSAVNSIRQAMYQAINLPQTGNLGQDITNILLTRHADMVKAENIIGYGAFAIQADHWLTGARHAVFSHNQSMYLRYDLREIKLYPTPQVALSPEIDVLKNGNFEAWWREKYAVAPYWQAYDNGRSHFGWYKEEWDEAVSKSKNLQDKQSQLMEIGIVDPYADNRIMAIYQSADVVPNSNYKLTLEALMRTEYPFNQLNTGEVGMAWGVDYQGTGNYNNVTEWFTMTLTEQPRRGSRDPLPGASYEESLLHFDKITGNVFTGQSQRITLFIRGVKVHANTVEVNFNVDNVSLVGPSAAYVANPPTPTPPMTSTETSKAKSGPILFLRQTETPVAAIVVTSTSGITATATPTPQPTPQVPTDALQFVTYLKNKYDEINGQAMPLEGVYLQNSPMFGRAVLINVNSIGLTVFSTQTAEIKTRYGEDLMRDVAAYFNQKDNSVQVTNWRFNNFNQTQANCVQVAEAIACPNLELTSGYKTEGPILLSGKFKNGVATVELKQ